MTKEESEERINILLIILAIVLNIVVVPYLAMIIPYFTKENILKVMKPKKVQEQEVKCK